MLLKIRIILFYGWGKMSFCGKLNFFVKLCIFYYAINFSRNNYTSLKAKFKLMNKDMMKSLKGFKSTHNGKLVVLWLGVFVKGWFHYQGKNNHLFGSFKVRSCFSEILFVNGCPINELFKTLHYLC